MGPPRRRGPRAPRPPGPRAPRPRGPKAPRAPRPHRLTYEINTADHPVVTTPSVPPSLVKLIGPCALGHRTPSSQGAFGEAVWHQVPEGRKWKNARAGDTLCFACFQKMRRCKQPQETEASDDDEESLVDHYFKRIKLEHAATHAKANNDKILPGLDRSGYSAANSL